MIKSFLLLSLTISALILTGAVFMREDAVEEVPVEAYEDQNLLELIRPQNYVFSFGDLFIKIYDDTYENIPVRQSYERVFKSFFDTSLNVTPSLINQDIWDENINRRSILVDYPVNLTLEELLIVNDYDVETNVDEKVYMSQLLFLLNDKDAIFVYDEVNDAYYEISGVEQDLWIDDLFYLIDDVKNEEDIYLPLETRYALSQTSLRKYDLDTTNMLLTPMASDVYYRTYDVMHKLDHPSTSKNLEDISKVVFDNNLSYVRKSVYEDDEVLYMYGYGERIFRYNPDGSIEYTEKTSENSEKKAIGIKEGLSIFLDKVNKDNETNKDKFGIISNSMYLSGYNVIETESTIETRYYFNYTKEGIPFYNEHMPGGHVIEIRFINGEFSRLKKYIRIATLGQDVPHEDRDFKSILSENRLTFELEYEKDNPDLDIEEKDIYDMALQEMTRIEPRYMLIGDLLIPTWHITIDETDYIIDLTTRKVISIDGGMIE